MWLSLLKDSVQTTSRLTSNINNRFSSNIPGKMMFELLHTYLGSYFFLCVCVCQSGDSNRLTINRLPCFNAASQTRKNHLLLFCNGTRLCLTCLKTFKYFLKALQTMLNQCLFLGAGIHGVT